MTKSKKKCYNLHTTFQMTAGQFIIFDRRRWFHFVNCLFALKKKVSWWSEPSSWYWSTLFSQSSSTFIFFWKKVAKQVTFVPGHLRLIFLHVENHLIGMMVSLLIFFLVSIDTWATMFMKVNHPLPFWRGTKKNEPKLIIVLCHHDGLLERSRRKKNWPHISCGNIKHSFELYRDDDCVSCWCVCGSFFFSFIFLWKTFSHKKGGLWYVMTFWHTDQCVMLCGNKGSMTSFIFCLVFSPAEWTRKAKKRLAEIDMAVISIWYMIYDVVLMWSWILW